MIGVYSGRNGELNFESDIIELLLSTGWQEVISHPTKKILEDNLRQILNENNIDKLGSTTLLTDGEFAQIIEKINVDCMTPVAANVFINGKKVSIISEIQRQNYNVGDEIYLYIFNPVEVAGGKSRYQIAEQPIFDTSDQYNDRRGDILLLINGFPLIHIELKASGHELTEGTDQIQKYMNEGVYTGIFCLIQVFFVLTPEDCIYFANSYPTLNPAFMFHWGDETNNAITNWQDLIVGKNQILSIPEAHQLIGYYTNACIEKDSKGCISNINSGVLMVARSYQVYAIRNVMKRVKLQCWGTHNPLGGYIWGTTGCGKTLTSYKSGQLLIDKNYADKVVFVVDRKELDEQSYNEYMSFARDGEPIKRTENTHTLFKALLNDTNRLIITSIQKLSRVNDEITEYIDKQKIEKINNKRIVFIIDEAHRSQFGKMHKCIKNTFTNALFIGFTGTPIFTESGKSDGVTSEVVFGRPLSIYSIASGIRDKNVLGFDPKMVKTFDDKDLRDKTACHFAKVSSMAEAKADKEKWKLYQNVYNLPMVDIEDSLPSQQYNCDEHRKAVVEDILSNWDLLSNVGGNIRFHALLATNTIPEACEYYHLLKKTGLKVTALFDTSVAKDTKQTIDKEKCLVEIVTDYNAMFGTNINRATDPSLKIFKSDVTRRLAHKEPYKNLTEKETLDICIVVDQLLTGFDSKYVNTLYLDKVLESDGLIQAISRTNRVIDFDEKPWGIFRYYRKPYTMEQNIKEALRLYCEGGEDSGAIVGNIDANLVLANQLYEAIKKLFETAGIQNFMSLPQLDADCQKFKQLFRNLKQTINGMKLQGMKFPSDTDAYALRLEVWKKWNNNPEWHIYDILKMRYADLLTHKDNRSISTGRLGYDLTAHLSEVENDKIDADYLETHFKQIVPTLMGDFEDEVKERAVQEFENQLAILSAEQQKYARIIIKDIRDGKLEIGEKTLHSFIAEYQEKAERQAIRKFSVTYGLDEKLLQKIYHVKGNHDIEISKLLDTCNKFNVETQFGCKWFVARAKLNNVIKEFIE